MKITVSENEFLKGFLELRPDQFSGEAIRALFNYIEALEENIGEEIEFDVIALCCEWSEDEKEEVLNNYNLETVEQLQKKTTVIELSNGNLLYQNF